MDNLKKLTNHKYWNAIPGVVKNSTSFYNKWVHYLDSSQEWKEIDCGLVYRLSGFEVEKAPFYFQAARRSTGYHRIIANNRFDIFDGPEGTKTLITAPEFEQVVRCLDVEDVAGELSAANSVLYPGAYASTFAGDLIVRVQNSRAPRIQKIIRFLQAPTQDVSASFEIEFSGKTELTPRNLKQGEIREEERDKWNSNLFKGDYLYLHSESQDNGGLYVRPWDEVQKRGMGIKKPIIWDSSVRESGLPKVHSLETYIKRVSGNKYILVKIIPKSFFEDVVFPVFCDTTSTFFPDADPETTSVDGWTISAGSVSWALAQNNAGSSSNDSSSTSLPGPLRSGGGSWFIRRGFTLFDTSSIPDTDVVSSGIASLWTISTNDNDNDADAYLAPVHASPASNTSLVAADYTQCGDSVDNPTELAAGLDLTGAPTSQYNDFTINDLSTISKTSISKYGWREGHDMHDSAPSLVAGQSSRLTHATAEEPTPGRSPKLTVVHAGLGGGVPVFDHHYRQMRAC